MGAHKTSIIQDFFPWIIVTFEVVAQWAVPVPYTNKIDARPGASDHLVAGTRPDKHTQTPDLNKTATAVPPGPSGGGGGGGGGNKQRTGR